MNTMSINILIILVLEKQGRIERKRKSGYCALIFLQFLCYKNIIKQAGAELCQAQQKLEFAFVGTELSFPLYIIKFGLEIAEIGKK